LRQQVASLILELKADGVTQIVVTHDLDFAEEIGIAKRCFCPPDNW
jgi:polar amino acid transport system ATP-binding protein